MILDSWKGTQAPFQEEQSGSESGIVGFLLFRGRGLGAGSWTGCQLVQITNTLMHTKLMHTLPRDNVPEAS